MIKDRKVKGYHKEDRILFKNRINKNGKDSNN